MSALPRKYTASILDPTLEPPRIRTRGSQSPPERDHESRGGGSGSRRRSPGYGNGSGRDERGGDRYDRDRRHGRDARDARDARGDGDRGSRGGRGGAYEDRRSRDQGRSRDRSISPGKEKFPGRPRDNGYGSRDGNGSGPKKEYTNEEQEKDRALQRRAYEDNAVDKPKEPPKPNFAPSGLLAKETNTVAGVQLKYNEPPEARKPLKNWRLYVFKGKDQVDLVHIYKQSCYLVGRDDKITDIAVNHPSCSKQHAAFQYRQVQSRNEYGDVSTAINPYIIDLESTNGTFVNDIEIPKASYYQLKHTDVIKFGTSTREYVLVQEDVSA